MQTVARIKTTSPWRFSGMSPELPATNLLLDLLQLLFSFSFSDEGFEEEVEMLPWKQTNIVWARERMRLLKVEEI